MVTPQPRRPSSRLNPAWFAIGVPAAIGLIAMIAIVFSGRDESTFKDGSQGRSSSRDLGTKKDPISRATVDDLRGGKLKLLTEFLAEKKSLGVEQVFPGESDREAMLTFAGWESASNAASGMDPLSSLDEDAALATNKLVVFVSDEGSEERAEARIADMPPSYAKEGRVARYGRFILAGDPKYVAAIVESLP